MNDHGEHGLDDPKLSAMMRNLFTVRWEHIVKGRPIRVVADEIRDNYKNSDGSEMCPVCELVLFGMLTCVAIEKTAEKAR